MNLLLLSLGLGAISDFVSIGSTIAFVPTAGHPYENPSFVNEDRDRLTRLGYNLVEIDFRDVKADEVQRVLGDVDAVFVAGGNTFYLLQEIQRQGISEVIRAAVGGGLPYIGASAGAVIAGPSVEPVQTLDDVLAAPDLHGWDGLGLTDIVVLPHYGKEKYLPKYNAVLENYGSKFKLIPLRDNQAVVIEAGKEPVVVDSKLIA